MALPRRAMTRNHHLEVIPDQCLKCVTVRCLRAPEPAQQSAWPHERSLQELRQ